MSIELEKNLFKLILIPIIFLTSNSTSLADTYGEAALSGIKTAWIKTSQASDANCDYPKNLRDSATPLIIEIKNLGLTTFTDDEVEKGAIPDITILIMTEAVAASNIKSVGLCSFLVKVEAFHTMLGRMRYKNSTTPIRALVHRNIFYGTSYKDEVGMHLEKTALRGIAIFGLDYQKANSEANSSK